MATMYPPTFPADKAGDADGERAAFDALASLPSDIHVVYEPRLRSRGGIATPDFIVAVPDFGVVVLEAKRWFDIVASDGRQVTVGRRDGTRFTTTHPLEQARSALFALKERLQGDGSFLHDTGPHVGKLSLPLGAAILWLGDGSKPSDVAESLKGVEPDAVITQSDLREPESLLRAIRRVPMPFVGVFSAEAAERVATGLSTSVNELEVFEQKRGLLCGIHDAALAAVAEFDEVSFAADIAASRERLLDGRFSVAFFGSFSAGKTTLVNGLVRGLDLPTSALPTTAVPTMIERTPIRQAHVHYRSRDQVERLNRLLPEIEHLDPTYPNLGLVVELENPAEVAHVIRDGDVARYVDRVVLGVTTVGLPSCLRLLDLPGTDSLQRQHRVVAEMCIPLADIIVFVVNAEHALGEAEGDILRALQSSGRSSGFDKFVFFLNRIDGVSEPRIVEQRVRDVLQGDFGFDSPRIISGCALLGEVCQIAEVDGQGGEGARLLRRVRRGAQYTVDCAMSASGVPVLRELLESMASSRRGQLVLQSAVDNLAHVVDAWAVSVRFDREQSSAARESTLAELERLRSRLDTADLPQARQEVQGIADAAKTSLLALVKSTSSLRVELGAVISEVGLDDCDDQAAMEAMHQVEQHWVRSIQEHLVRELVDLEDGLGARIREFEFALTGDLLTQSRAESVFRSGLNLRYRAEPLKVYVPRQDAAEKGLMSAVLTGAAMGMTSGSIFPGVGNVAGAVIGGVLAGFGVFGGIRMFAKEKIKAAVGERVDNIESGLQELVVALIHGCRSRADDALTSLSGEVAELEAQFRAATARGSAVDGSSKDHEAQQDALDDLDMQLQEFCASAGLVRPQPMLSTALAKRD